MDAAHYNSGENSTRETFSPEADQIRAAFQTRYSETYGSGDMVDNLIQVGSNTVVVESDLNWLRNEAVRVYQQKLAENHSGISDEDLQDQVLLYMQEALSLDAMLRMEVEFPQITRFGMSNITALNVLDNHGLLFSEGDLGAQIMEKQRAHNATTSVPPHYKVAPVVAGIRSISNDNSPSTDSKQTQGGYGRRHPFSGAYETQ